MSSKEIYVSTDVEADGPIPGPNSMLSFGSAAYTGGKELIGTFSANLETLPDATADPKTAEWWAQQPEAWAACRQELEMPERAMRRYVLWLKALPGKPVFVGYPAGFDFLFVYWYLIRFVGESPFSFSVLDIKTYAMALLRISLLPARNCKSSSIHQTSASPRNVLERSAASNETRRQGSLHREPLPSVIEARAR
jgi:hypothetical protein